MAVAMRDLSTLTDQREAVANVLPRPTSSYAGEKKAFVEMLHNALYVAMIAAYAQGMALLKAASDAYHYELPLDEVARTWRGGCIIRASLLEHVRAAFLSHPDLSNLMMDETLSRAIIEREQDLRRVIQQGVISGIPIPGFMGSLAYLDAFRSRWLPANLIQAQRDFFGSHTYERIDEKGVFHTKWEQE
jgi:6-phosphogluconate dehydrogenase